MGVQEELAKAREQIKFLEEERDAFKAAAQSEEIARIAAEGRLPLPPEEPDTEFASPRKDLEGRLSLSTFEIVSSAATEAEIEELTRLWQWEKQRADRAQDHLEFVQTELELCSLHPKSHLRRSLAGTPRKERAGPTEIVDPSDLMILGKEAEASESPMSTVTTYPEKTIKTEPLEHNEEVVESTDLEPPIETTQLEMTSQSQRKEPRRGTIFVPSEGIFRTISQHQLEAMKHDDEDTVVEKSAPVHSQADHARYSRTPSVEPPSFALMVHERTSLLSLLNAPRESEAHMGINIPTSSCAIDDEEASETTEAAPTHVNPKSSATDLRPHTSAAFYTVTTTTTVPIQDENAKPAPLAWAHNRAPSFDVNDPAMTPTMTREQALAQIRERRGRAKSAMLGNMTPRKQMVAGVGDRNASAPAGRAAKGRTA